MSARASWLHAAHRITRNYLHATARASRVLLDTLPDVRRESPFCGLRFRDVCV